MPLLPTGSEITLTSSRFLFSVCGGIEGCGGGTGPFFACGGGSMVGPGVVDADSMLGSEVVL